MTQIHIVAKSGSDRSPRLSPLAPSRFYPELPRDIRLLSSILLPLKLEVSLSESGSFQVHLALSQNPTVNTLQ